MGPVIVLLGESAMPILESRRNECLTRALPLGRNQRHVRSETRSGI